MAELAFPGASAVLALCPTQSFVFFLHTHVNIQHDSIMWPVALHYVYRTNGCRTHKQTTTFQNLTTENHDKHYLKGSFVVLIKISVNSIGILVRAR
jgi:hypothetical protein